MKRPEMTVIFAGVATEPVALAEQWLAFTVDELSSSLNEGYFANMEFNADMQEYEFVNERLNLQGREELMKLIAENKNGVWNCRMGFGYINAEVYTALFQAGDQHDQAVLLLQIESTFTHFFEEYQKARMYFLSVFSRMAQSIGSPYFFAGPFLPLRPLPPDPEENIELLVYGAGWLADHDGDRRINARFKQINEQLYGYKVVSRFIV